MNQLNESIVAGLKRAMGALFTLDDRGVTVTRVSLDGGMPVVFLDARPPFPLPHEPTITHVRDGNMPPQRLCRIEVGGVFLRWYEAVGVH